METEAVKVMGDLPTLNIHLLRDLVLWAGKDKAAIDKAFDGWGDWEQNVWAREVRNGVCKSSYCIAGQAVVQAGYILNLTQDYRNTDGSVHLSADYCSPAVKVGTDEKGKPLYRADERKMQMIDRVAAEVLGLDDDEDCLFNGSNSFETVVSLASYFARRRGLDMDFPPEVQQYDQQITDAQFESFLENEDFDCEPYH